MSDSQALCNSCKRWSQKHTGCLTPECVAPAPAQLQAFFEVLAALDDKATPAPWHSRGVGGDSILTALTHKWHKPGPQDSGYPIGVPRTFPYPSGKGTYTDFSAGFAHDDGRLIELLRNGVPVIKKALAERADLLAAMQEITPFLNDAFVNTPGSGERYDALKRFRAAISKAQGAEG